jgi:hypothetical protein
MITGDLVKCNKTGSLGIVTQIVDKNPHTGNIDWIYRVLWTEPKTYANSGTERALSWERTDNFTPLTDEEYAV